LSDHWFMWVCVFAVATMVAPLFAWWQRRRVVDEDGVCAGCGYAVRGLSGPICPECGADINDVGLRYPSAWNSFSIRTRRLVGVGVWTAWLIALLLLGWAPYERLLQPGGRSIGDSVNCEKTGAGWRIVIARSWYVEGLGFDNVVAPPVGAVPERWGVRLDRDPGPWCGWGPSALDAQRRLEDPYFSCDAEAGFFVFDTLSACYAWSDPTDDHLRLKINGACDGEWREPLQSWLDRNWGDALGAGLFDDVVALRDAVERQPFLKPFGTVSGWTMTYGGSGRDVWEAGPRGNNAIAIGLGALWIVGVWWLCRRRASAVESASTGRVATDEASRDSAIGPGPDAIIRRRKRLTAFLTRVAFCVGLTLVFAYGGLSGYRYWEFGQRLKKVRASLIALTGVYQSLPDEIVQSRRGQEMLKDLLLSNATSPFVAGAIFRDLKEAGVEGLDEALIAACRARRAYRGNRPYDWSWVSDEFRDFPGVHAADLSVSLTTSDNVSDRLGAASQLRNLAQYLDQKTIRGAFDNEASIEVRIAIAYLLRKMGDHHSDAWINRIVLEHADDSDPAVFRAAKRVQDTPHAESRQE